ncbi:hypothetical protein DV736_g1310, partial [Chaetothyriales sp. CBS 134916]
MLVLRALALLATLPLSFATPSSSWTGTYGSIQYSTVTGYFLQDYNATNATTFSYSDTNFGLINQSYPTDPKNGPKLSQWQRFNILLLFLGRHGEGWHNAAESYYGTPAWNCYYSLLDGNATASWADAKLTSNGVSQALVANRLWAKLISKQNIQVPQTYYTSPLSRCLATANLTFSALHLPNPYPFTGVTAETSDAQNIRSKQLLDDVFSHERSTYISFTSHSGELASVLTVLGHRAFPLSTGAVIPVLVKAQWLPATSTVTAASWTPSPHCLLPPITSISNGSNGGCVCPNSAAPATQTLGGTVPASVQATQIASTVQIPLCYHSESAPPSTRPLGRSRAAGACRTCIRIESDVNGPKASMSSTQDDSADHMPQLDDEDAAGSDNVDDGSSADKLPSPPDDSPASLLSSPRSESSSLATPPRGRRSLTYRPFDRRFQTRLTCSPLATPRALSPGHAAHSRQSSLASLGFPVASEADESTAPWDVIRWHKLKRVTAQAFSETAKRNFGHATCLAVTDTIVIGTSKGLILVFDHQQIHKAIMGPGTKAVEKGAISALAISADHSTVAAGHATGHIFTWEIARPTKPFLAIPPIDISLPQGRRTEGHVSGCAVVHVGFLGYRRTALVSADDRGMAFSHLATRGLGAIGRTVKTTRILGRYPDVIARSSKPLKKSSVLAFSALPLGNVERRTDGMGLVAMLTPYLLVIVSTTPIAQTQHKSTRPRDMAAHSAMTAALAWFPSIRLKGSDSQSSKVKLAYAWSNVLTILQVEELVADENADKDKPPELQFLPRSRFHAEEAIVAIQWLSRSVIVVLTITQQLLVLEDVSMTVSDSFDLIPKNLYHIDLFSQQLRAVIENLDEEDASMHGVVADAFHMSFRAYKGRLFLLGFNDIWWGSLTNWADRLLALMDMGDFIAAIRLATRYYQGFGEKLTIGLPEDDAARERLVSDKLFEMMAASLKYAFGKNQQANNGPVEKPQMAELADVCINACLATDDQDFLFDTVFPWYEDHGAGPHFVDVMEPYILDKKISSMPPPAIKILIDHFSTTHSHSSLEEIICMLDTTSMDLDQVTTLCKKHNLYDAYIYVWNRSMTDFVTPLEELLQLAAQSMEINGHSDSQQRRIDNAQKIFPYLSFLLTGRTYPTGMLLDDDKAEAAKSQIYNFFFSTLPSKPDRSRRRTSSPSGIKPYANLRSILIFDTPAFFSMLNEAFEDSFLNPPDEDSINATVTLSSSQKIGYNRQFIIKVMLDVMASGFDVDHTIYLDMFIARNLPKYTQYILLPGTTMQDVFTRLCHYPDQSMREDAQLSIEYLLALYQPSNLRSLVPLLRGAEFYRVLKALFRKAHQYADVVEMYFKDPDDQDGVFDVLLEFLRKGADVPPPQQQRVIEIVKEHAHDLIAIDVHRTATTIDHTADQLHPFFLDALADQDRQQFEYLSELFEPTPNAPLQSRGRPPAMFEMYIRLMCRFNADHVPDFVDTVKEGDLRLDKVLPTMEQTGIIDAAVILQARSGHVKEAMQQLNAHLTSLDGALLALVDFAASAADSHLSDTVQDILASISKYARVGIFLCRSQTRSAHHNHRPITRTPKRSASALPPLSFDEQLWLSLVETVVAIARHISQSAPESFDQEIGNLQQSVISSLRTTIQSVFTALLTSTTSISSPATAFSATPPADHSFLRILRTFISNQAKTSPSLSEMRSVLNTIFSAYAYEESLLALSNRMLDKDVFGQLESVKEARVKGWRPRGWGCEKPML